MRRYPIHTFLIAAFPVTFLYSHNVFETSITEIFLSLALILLLSALFWLALKLILKNSMKAGLVVSLGILLFFSYGHIVNAVFGMMFWGKIIGQPRLVLLLLLLIFVLGTFAILKMRKNIPKLTYMANVAGITLVAISVIASVYKIAVGPTVKVETCTISATTIPQQPPDIYYIILDGYGRADILKELYDFDNSEFIGYLERNGFFVADSSCPNYCQTFLSLASSLNMRYLDDIAAAVGADVDDRRPLEEMIHKNEVIRFLREVGYTIVTFSSGFAATEIRSADIYFSGRMNLNEFQNILLATTPIPKILSKMVSQYGAHRRRLLYILDRLAKVPETGKPVFVFAHIVNPHPPFVFGENGEELNPDLPFSLADGHTDDRCAGGSTEGYVKGYRGNVKWLNGKVMTTIDRILSKSHTSPIIILQGDHGPGSQLYWCDFSKTNLHERMTMLNAYHLPDTTGSGLYRGITPVNSFRVIFNHYFGTNLKILEDRSYFSLWEKPYQLIDVTDEIRGTGSSVNTSSAN